MDLETFVRESIVQVINGVLAAQEVAEPLGAKVSPACRNNFKSTEPFLTDDETKQPLTTIEFDLAITASSSSGQKGHVGLSVWGVGASGDGERGTKNVHVSRLRFPVPILLPVHDAREYGP